MIADAPPLSPELRLLAACDLATDERLAEEFKLTQVTAFDWMRFEHLVSCNSMGGLVGARLKPHADHSMPASVREYLDGRIRAHTLSQMLNTSETTRLVRELEALGIRTLVLKGAAIAHTLYAPHPERRFSSDIDLLAAPEDFCAADRALLESGYRRETPDWDCKGAGFDMMLHLLNHFSYRHQTLGMEVELHHRLTLNPHWMTVNFEDTYTGATGFNAGGETLRGLGGPTLRSYIAWHALGHPGFRIKWFSDNVRAWRALSEVQRADTRAACERQGSGHAVDLVCAVSARLFAHAVEPDKLPPFSSAGKIHWPVVRSIVTDLERGEELPVGRSIGGLRREFQFLRFALELCPDVRAKRYQLLRPMTGPRDVAALRLGRRWSWLYALAGPLFALIRYFLHGVARLKPAATD